MADLNPRSLKQRSAERLAGASWDPKQLVLIHTGVVVILNLIVNGLNLYLNQQIGSTGGLGGLGLRSILQTAQTVLQYFSAFFTPFWSAGFLFSMINIARGRNTAPADLLHGFRRFGSILSYTLWEMLIMTAAGMILMYLVCFLYVASPFSEEFLNILDEWMQQPGFFLADGSVNMDLVPMDQLFPAISAMLVVYAVIMIPLWALIQYHFRMGTFLLVEGIPRGAFGAFIVSSKLMKGHKWQMLKLDLSFWWYYLLEGLLVLVLYLDVLLPVMGVDLPFDSTVVYFTTIALYGVLQLALYWWKKADVDATYACAYEAIYREVVPEDTEVPANGY